MAALTNAGGGGFMADYDVFPVSHAPKITKQQNTNMNDFLPYEGDFSVYCKIHTTNNKYNDVGMPCLMSGRGDEWNRMTEDILQIITTELQKRQNDNNNNYDDGVMWSDTVALYRLRGKYLLHDTVLLADQVLIRPSSNSNNIQKENAKGELLLPYWNKEHCNITSFKHAVHFSYDTIRKAPYLPSETTLQDRPTIIRRFINSWKDTCL